MINIRKALLKDAEDIASLLLLAMEDIVYKFIGIPDHHKAKDFMMYFVVRENNQYSFQNCWVAEVENEIVAAANVYNGARLTELRQPVVEHIKNHFNQHFEPEDETGEGEYYIDTLGVKPNHQGKGIGSSVLQFLINEYVDRKHQTLGLLVDEENPAAKRLYIKLGFSSSGKRVLFGKMMEHLQNKPHFH